MLFIPQGRALDFSSICGEYNIYGSMIMSENGEAKFVANAGTLSEVQFKLTNKQEMRLAPYLNRSTKIRGKITKKMDGKLGELAEIKSAEYVVPDPAKLTSKHGLQLIKSGKCK